MSSDRQIDYWDSIGKDLYRLEFDADMEGKHVVTRKLRLEAELADVIDEAVSLHKRIALRLKYGETYLAAYLAGTGMKEPGFGFEIPANEVKEYMNQNTALVLRLKEDVEYKLAEAQSIRTKLGLIDSKKAQARSEDVKPESIKRAKQRARAKLREKVYRALK
jgi:hypothetical protein